LRFSTGREVSGSDAITAKNYDHPLFRVYDGALADEYAVSLRTLVVV